MLLVHMGNGWVSLYPCHPLSSPVYMQLRVFTWDREAKPLDMHHALLDKLRSSECIEDGFIDVQGCDESAWRYLPKPSETAMKKCCRIASWELNISPTSRHFWVDDFPFPQVGYVSSLEKHIAFHIATLPRAAQVALNHCSPQNLIVERVRVIVIGCDCKSVGEPCFEIFRLFGIMTHLYRWMNQSTTQANTENLKYYPKLFHVCFTKSQFNAVFSPSPSHFSPSSLISHLL